MARVQLRKIAHARSGDKGYCSNIGLIALRPEHYAAITEQVGVIEPPLVSGATS